MSTVPHNLHPSLLLTAEEFQALNPEQPCELLDGDVIYLSPSSAEHGSISANLCADLRTFVRSNKLGVVLGAETGFKLAPRRVRAPDVSFIRAARLPVDRHLPEHFWDGAPDLAVEVISPDDRLRAVIDKAQDWLKHGAQSVWIINPRNRTATIYHQAGPPEVLTESDTLSDPTVLPGLAISVKDIFAPTW